MQAHPRNESNRKAAAQLSAIVESMRNESQAWNKELTRLEDYEAETSRLETLLEQDNTTESGDVIAWDRQDLNETGLQQLRDAEAALDRLLRPEGHEVADTAKPKSRSKGRTSKAAAARNEDEAELKGTEHDTRWADVEFNVSISTSPYLNADTPLCQGHTNTEADQLPRCIPQVDLLRSRSHQFAQLESLASRYVRTVSAHAAQALRDRTSSSSAMAGTSSSSAKGGRRKTAAGKKDGSERLEVLLSGVRESRSISQPSTDTKSSNAADQSMADQSTSMVAVEPDESDPTDLLRALARMQS